MSEPSTVTDVTPKAAKKIAPKKDANLERLCGLRFVQFIVPIKPGGGIAQVPAIVSDDVTTLTLAKWRGLDVVLIESRDPAVGTSMCGWGNVANTEEL